MDSEEATLENLGETKERTETTMMPSEQDPSKSMQAGNTEDSPTKTNTDEEDVIQDPNLAVWISTLSEPYKTSLHMRLIEKKPYQEIAKAMCLAIGTVKSHVCRGKKLLQKRRDANEVDEQALKRETEEARPSIEHAVARKQVPEPYRTVLQLHYVEKQTYATIASELQKPIGTVKSYISRGKKFLSGATV